MVIPASGVRDVVRCAAGYYRENTRISQLIGAPSLLNAPITARAPAHILRRVRSKQGVQLCGAKHVHSCAAATASLLHPPFRALALALERRSCIVDKSLVLKKEQ